MLKVLALSLYGPLAASHRVRLSQFKVGLEAKGISLEIDSLLDNTYVAHKFSGRTPPLWRLFFAYLKRLKLLLNAKHFDLLIVYGELFPFFPWWLENLFLKNRFIYDCDDAFYLKYRTGRSMWLAPLLGAKFDRMMASAVAVTVGNNALARYAASFNDNVALLFSVVDTSHYRPLISKVPVLPTIPFTVGWIGSPSTAPYLQMLVEPLQQLALDRPVRLMVVGGSAPRFSGVEVVEEPWSLENEVSLIRQFDVGVMPLPNTNWTRGKCAYKLIQCMSCGIPVVASPVGANVDLVLPGCGLLAETSSQWLFAFRQLACDFDLRKRLGAAGRKRVDQYYSLQSALQVLVDVIYQSANTTISG